VKKLTRKVTKTLPGRVALVVLGACLIAGSVVLLVTDDGKDDTKRVATVSTATTPKPPTDANATTVPTTTTDTTTATTPAKPKPKPKPKKPKPKPKPVTLLPPVVFASDRAQKNYALAQATGSIKRPTTVTMQVGAAPKQPVSINWNVVCLFASGAKTTSDSVTMTPPLELKLTLPPGQASTCTISAQAQLTLAGVGRVKVFLRGVRRSR
jgi:outer membrane biosynthesis protein TonB